MYGKKITATLLTILLVFAMLPVETAFGAEPDCEMSELIEMSEAGDSDLIIEDLLEEEPEELLTDEAPEEEPEELLIDETSGEVMEDDIQEEVPADETPDGEDVPQLGDGFEAGDFKYSVNDDGKSVTLIGVINDYDKTKGLQIPIGALYNGKYLPITAIGVSAFYFGGFSGQLIFATGSKITSIGANAFKGCSGLTGSLTLPSNVTSIGASTFEGCSGLTGSLTLPSNVTSIGAGAFMNCSGLNGSLTLPSNVTSIGASTFEGCKGLTGSLTLPSNVTSIGAGAFEGCSGLNGSLTLPSNLETIGEGAFRNCSRFIGSLTLPSNLETIGEGAFKNCSRFIGSLTLPSGLTSIEKEAFYNCNGLNGTLTIPSTVTSIGDKAFYNCYSLTGPLTIPSKVSSIGKCAFQYCEGFDGALTIPDSVTQIADNAFYGTLFETITNNSNIEIPCEAILRKNYTYYDENGYEVDKIGKGTYVLAGGESISGASITIDPTSYTYSGRECKPDVTVKLGKVELKAGTDYTVTYKDNINAGTATVTATGRWKYKDSVSATFEIGKADQTVNIASTSFTRTMGDASFSLGATASGGGELTYTSGNTSVVTVDNSGTVNIKGVGNTTIKIDAEDTANYKAATKTVNVTVKEAPVTKYVVTALTDGNGTASASPASGATGTMVTITADPKNGYEFKEWTVVSGGVSLADPKKASTTFKIKSANVEVKALFKQKTTPTPDPNKTDISGATVTLSKKSFAYKNKAQKPTVKSVTLGKKTLTLDKDYTVSYSNKSSKNVGTYKVTVSGIGKYTGSVSATYKIKQASNPMKVSLKKKELNVKLKKLKKKDQTISRSTYLTVSKAQGDVTYTKTSGDKKITVNSKNGKIKISKKLKKGTYSIKISVKAEGNNNYKASTTQKVKFKIVVK